MPESRRPISLAFNAARAPAFKVADFTDPEGKRAYVDAETANLACQDAWLAYQAARTIEARKTAAGRLDIMRWNFYKLWRRNQREVIDLDDPGVA